MPSTVRLEWNGDQLLERVTAAAREAVNETVDDARDDAAASHVWVNRTGQLEEEVVSEHADPADSNPTGRFGTTRRRGFYGLFHEEGTVREHATPFLRPAADRHFSTLAERIARRFR